VLTSDLPSLLLLLLPQIKGFAKSLRGEGGAPGFWMRLLGPKGPPPVRQPVSHCVTNSSL
jgi:hypothetical protein